MSTDSEPGVWINRATTENGTSYYKYMLVYVDDVLHPAKYAKKYMLKLNKVYRLKEGFRPTDRYLGANVNRVKLDYGRTVCSMTCIEYMCVFIKNVD